MPDHTADLAVDIRELKEVMPFVWASGKPLIFVAAFQYGVRYAIWKPGMADFRPYYPDPEKERTPYDVYWDVSDSCCVAEAARPEAPRSAGGEP
jgi:hypothetical protein